MKKTFVRILLSILYISSVFNTFGQTNPNIDQLKLVLKKTSFYNDKNSDSAYYYLFKADILTREYPNSDERCRYFQMLGDYLKFNKKLDAAEKAYMEMFKIATFLKNDYRIKASLYNKATVKVEKGEFLNAAIIYYSLENIILKSIKKGVDENEAKQNKVLLFLTYNSLAMIFQNLENRTKNSFYLRKMEPLVQSKYDSLLYNFALSTYSLNESHHKYYLPALELAIAQKDTFLIKEIYSEMGYWYVKKGFYKSAWDYANKSLALKLKMANDWKYDLINFHTLGITNLNLRKFEKAEYFLKKAYEGFKENKQLDYEFKVLFDLSKLYEKKENYKEALNSFVLGQSIKDSLIGTFQQNRISQLNIDFQENLHKKEIYTENKEKKLILFLLMSSIFFLGLLSYNFVQKNKVNKKLAESRKRLEDNSNLLRESNATKDKLFAIISHDLRGPINNLVNYMYLLEDNYTPPKDYLSKLRFNIENVQVVLNNLFNWAEMQIKNTPPKIKKVVVLDMLTEIKKQFEDKILEKGILVKMDIKGEVVHADENYLHIILRNIVSNAVKFTTTNGVIDIFHKIDEAQSVLTIRDYGVGIGKEQLGKVFKYPSPKIGTNQEKGSGLGLTLCKELMEKQGGQLSIESYIGNGTAVSLIFPFTNSVE